MTIANFFAQNTATFDLVIVSKILHWQGMDIEGVISSSIDCLNPGGALFLKQRNHDGSGGRQLVNVKSVLQQLDDKLTRVWLESQDFSDGINAGKGEVLDGMMFYLGLKPQLSLKLPG
jgi:hypothetical protein